MQNDDNTTQDDKNQQPNSENIATPTQAQSIPVNFSTENEQSTPDATTSVTVNETEAQESEVATSEDGTPAESQAAVKNMPVENAEAAPDTISPDSASPSMPETPTATTVSDAQKLPPVIPKKKFSKKLLAIVLAILTAILLLAGGAFAYMSMQATPEERLQNAIINAASLTGVKQTVSIESSGEEGSDLKGTVTTESDVSDPAKPKTKGIIDLDVVLFGITINLTSEFVCVSQTECYVKYNEFKVPEELGQSDSAILNKWLKFDPSNKEQNADPFDLLGSVNTVLGEIITGNITGVSKDLVASYARDNTTYTFTSSSKDTINGINTIKYSLVLDTNNVYDLNKKVAEQYKIKSVFDDAKDITKNAALWVDTKSDRVVQVEINNNGVKSVITYSNFNETPQITVPETFLNPNEYVQIFQ